MKHDIGDGIVVGVGPHKGQSGLVEKHLGQGNYLVMVAYGTLIEMPGDALIPGDEFEYNWTKRQRREFYARIPAAPDRHN